MKEFGLLIIAIVLFTFFGVIGFVWQIINYPKHTKNYFFAIAKTIDQSGNVVCKQLFNDLLIKDDNCPFGNEDEKISKVLGVHKQKNNLTRPGKWLANFLNSIDKNHVENAIEKDKNHC